MKIKIALTQEEKEQTLDLVVFDPCAAIDCREIECEQCPLKNVADNVRKVCETFADVLNKLGDEGE